MNLLHTLEDLIRTLDYNFSNIQGADHDLLMPLFNRYSRKYDRKPMSPEKEPGIIKMIEEIIPLIEKHYDSFDNVNKADSLKLIAEYRNFVAKRNLSI